MLTGLPSTPDADGLCDRGALQVGRRRRCGCRLSPAFRELVVFTPPHRQAFCIEPYTCTTDAINLQAPAWTPAWLTLPPGGRWTAVFEMRLEPR